MRTFGSPIHPPDARVFPSGEKARHATPLGWALMDRSSLPDLMSQRRISTDVRPPKAGSGSPLFPEASVVPSGETARHPKVVKGALRTRCWAKAGAVAIT